MHPMDPLQPQTGQSQGPVDVVFGPGTQSTSEPVAGPCSCGWALFLQGFLAQIKDLKEE